MALPSEEADGNEVTSKHGRQRLAFVIVHSLANYISRSTDNSTLHVDELKQKKAHRPRGFRKMITAQNLETEVAAALAKGRTVYRSVSRQASRIILLD